MPREPEPVKKAAPPARNWADFDIPLDDEPAAPPAPKSAAPDLPLVEETVEKTLADAPVPKDEEDVRTMSLEDLLKDIHNM